MSHDTQATPAFRAGQATFPNAFIGAHSGALAHTLKLDIGSDYVLAEVHANGADPFLPLVSLYAYRPARTALLRGRPVLVLGHCYFPLDKPNHAAAVTFLDAHGAYEFTAGVDA